MFIMLCTPDMLGLPDAPVSAGADVVLSMAVTDGATSTMFCSNNGMSHRDMKLFTPVADAESVAAALGPHLEGWQLKLSFTVAYCNEGGLPADIDRRWIQAAYGWGAAEHWTDELQ